MNMQSFNDSQHSWNFDSSTTSDSTHTSQQSGDTPFYNSYPHPQCQNNTYAGFTQQVAPFNDCNAEFRPDTMYMANSNAGTFGHQSLPPAALALQPIQEDPTHLHPFLPSHVEYREQQGGQYLSYDHSAAASDGSFPSTPGSADYFPPDDPRLPPTDSYEQYVNTYGVTRHDHDIPPRPPNPFHRTSAALYGTDPASQWLSPTMATSSPWPSPDNQSSASSQAILSHNSAPRSNRTEPQPKGISIIYHTGQGPPKQRVACKNCRKLKQSCEPIDGSSVCKRCANHDQWNECIYESKRGKRNAAT